MYTPSFLPGSRTNRQDSRFARINRPEGSGQGCSECIQSHGRETWVHSQCLIEHLRSRPVTVHGTGFRQSMPE
jgi:hypothetical protein